MGLSADQYEQLQEALLSAYPTKQKLQMLLRLELDLVLNHYADGANYKELVFNLIGALEAEGDEKLSDLINAAHLRNPGNSKLKQFVASLSQGSSTSSSTDQQGPGFTWRGPEDDRELQGLLRPRQSVGFAGEFLKKATEQFDAVCRIEHVTKGAMGTGFLVAPNLLLTNYHVIAPNPTDDPQVFLHELLLKFAYLNDPSKASNSDSEIVSPLDDADKSTPSKPFKLAANPLLKASPVSRLDYALLKVEDAILAEAAIQPVTWDVTRLPDKDMGIHLLQHPEGQPMQVTFGENGITGVYQRDGLLQYISDTSVGSSGSPCFNDNWEVIALHHAQVAATFGVKCEGILFKPIFDEIEAILNQYTP